LTRPVLGIVTHKPIEQEATYQLPEAQLDRFMIKDLLPHPNPIEEVEILSRLDSGVFDRDSIPDPTCTLDGVVTMHRYARTIYIDPASNRYLVEIVQATRNTGKYLGRFAPYIEYGASPRASIAFTTAGRALAMIRGRNYVIPEDIKDLAHRVLAHRIQLNFE